MNDRVRAVIADDSPFVCALLKSHLESAQDIDVVGVANDGPAALRLVRELRPDVMTLDLTMPGADGLETLGTIMRECPTPVVVVSGVHARARDLAAAVSEIGAVDVVFKYKAGESTRPDQLLQEILLKVRAAARIKLVGSIPSVTSATTQNAGSPELCEEQSTTPLLPGGVVVIGASAGGPMALEQLLSQLPEDFPSAVLVVQHMKTGLTEVLVSHLRRFSKLPVKQARDGDVLEPGAILIAPGGSHLVLGPESRIRLQDRGAQASGFDEDAVDDHCPSIDVAMRSAARSYGRHARAVVLSGMGSDGAKGIAAVKAFGGQTFAQDQESSLLDSMPRRAFESGAVDRVGTPEIIGELLAGDKH